MEPPTKKGFFSRRVVFGTTIAGAVIFMIIGVVLWGGFNTAMEVTNTMEFCTACHEMRDNVYAEYQGSIHDANRSGVRASCSDCHVPRPWVHKVVRKVQATNELYHWLRGTVDTPEKFQEHRLVMAKRVWRSMKDTDSRECRNCHDFDTMDSARQKPRARKQHLNAMEQGNTCIDCHKGIAHEPVHKLLSEEEAEALEQPDPSLVREVPATFLEGIARAEAAEQEAKQAEQEQTRKQRESIEQAVQDAVAEYQTKIDELQALVAADAQAGGATAAAEASETTGVAGGEQAAVQGEGFGVDWSSAPVKEVVLFYPGQASIEWVLNGRDHSGVRAFKAGDRCVDCHDQEAADIGQKIVTGEILEPDVIPGKRGDIPVSIQAMHDGEFLYMRFQWPEGEHAPAPFVEGGKMDPDNPMKFAIMLSTDEVEFADRAGCWGTCHHDLRTMPHAPDAAALSAVALPFDAASGVTKYIKESRTKIEVRGRGDKPRGGWDKLKSAEEITAELDAGRFMELLRYQSGSGVNEDGHILEQRVMTGGVGLETSVALNGGTWVVELRRKLESDKPGDVSLALDQVYNIGFAIHDDFSNARFHHVSLGYKLGFDNDQVEINAVGL